jgi:conjugal transfer ATP-binding protein TraC
MNMSLYDSGRNYNACIVAESGSGKSFFTNELISSELSLGGQVWAIDVGRSYEKYCKSVGGEFIHFGPDSDICLNPFESVENYDEEADVLAALLVAMAAPRESLTNLQFSELRRIISEQWDVHNRSMTIDLVADALKDSSDQRVRDVGTQLWSFTSKGEYGKYFVGRNNVKFQNRFTVLELEELKGRKQLQTVVLLQLIMQIQNSMYLGQMSDRGRHKVVIIDEAWDLLTQGEVATFIEHGYRRFRKYGGAAVVVTQGLAELYASEQGTAIVNNSTNMYLLGMKSEAVDAIAKEGRLSIGPGGFQLLKTVRTDKGRYSEIFCRTDYGAGIGRLIVDKFRYLLYSTHPDDVGAIARQQALHPGIDVAQAIHRVMEERGWNNAA